MQVTKLIDGNISYKDIPRPTDEEMQNEYDYILAEKITRKLLDMGIISPDEFEKIMVKNRQSFAPFISRIGAK
jgi:hypothetical protein